MLSIELWHVMQASNVSLRLRITSSDRLSCVQSVSALASAELQLWFEPPQPLTRLAPQPMMISNPHPQAITFVLFFLLMEFPFNQSCCHGRKTLCTGEAEPYAQARAVLPRITMMVRASPISFFLSIGDPSLKYQAGKHWYDVVR